MSVSGNLENLSANAPGPGSDPGAGTGTLGKAIALLDLVARSDVPLRFSDVLRLTGQPRGSLHRQLRHLVVEGLLDLSADGAYVPGLRLLAFASRAWARNSARQLAEPHIRRLHERVGETVHFGELRGHKIVYLDKLESRQAVRMYSQVGNASPVHCTGIGKAALSCLDSVPLRTLLDQLVLEAFTPHTLTELVSLEAEIDDVRRRGISFDMEEHQPGIRCVAAPVASRAQGFIGGLSITAPAFRADIEQLNDWAPLLAAAASAIASDMDRGLSPR